MRLRGIVVEVDEVVLLAVPLQLRRLGPGAIPSLFPNCPAYQVDRERKLYTSIYMFRVCVNRHCVPCGARLNRLCLVHPCSPCLHAVVRRHQSGKIPKRSKCTHARAHTLRGHLSPSRSWKSVASGGAFRRRSTSPGPPISMSRKNISSIPTLWDSLNNSFSGVGHMPPMRETVSTQHADEREMPPRAFVITYGR